MTNQLARKPYPSDVTDAQWAILAPCIPEPGIWSPREPIARREIVNGILYLLRTGCSWRQMPHDVPNDKTVYHYFRTWKLDGTWEKAMTALRKQVRVQMGREEEPSAAIIDSQSMKTSPVRGRERGFDAGKKIFGRTRHLLVDTQGLILAVLVHAANLSDRDGARLLLQELVGRFPRLIHLFADHGYTGPLIAWIKELLGWDTEILPKAGNESHQKWILVDGKPVLKVLPKSGFHVQRHRWKVERTFGWLIRYRRLARDYEGLPASSQALIQIAAIRLFFTRVTPFRSIVTSLRHTLK
jgi:putative transposase